MSEHHNEQQPQPEVPAGGSPEGDQIGDVFEVDIPGSELREELQPKPAPPQIWVCSLADYNNGILHGQWIDAARDPDDIYSDIRAMLARSETPLAEEWGIFDHDGFGPVRIGEYEAIELVSRVARGIAEHGPAYAAWALLHWDDEDRRDDDLGERFTDDYLGHFDSREDWAQGMVDDLGVEESLTKGLPGIIAAYIRIDYVGIAHDMEISGEVDIEDDPDGGIWVFNTR